MNVREFGYYFARNRKGLLNRMVMEWHLPVRPQWTIFWRDAAFYDTLDVAGRTVIDVGCDYGVTPMYFLSRGAKKVIGFSEWPQRFYSFDYRHIRGHATADQIMDRCPSCDDRVLKTDVEGLEWDFDPEWIGKFHDWIIVCHYPVRNQELLDWLKKHGTLIGSQPEVNEFAIYQRSSLPSV